MASDAITGIDGTLTKDGSEIADVRSFTVTRENEVKTYASSSTDGRQKTAKGISRWRLDAEIYLPGGDFDVGLTEGETYTLIGQTVSGKTFTGTARVRSIGEAIPIETADMLVASVSCEGDGEYTIV